MQTPHDQFQQYKANPTVNFGKIPHNVFPGCTSVHLSVMLSPPKPLDEIQPNLVSSYSYEWGVHVKLLWPHPLGPGEGSKGQISFNFNYRFLYQTVCVFLQMKDTKHIRRGFHSVAWVMPQGWNFVTLGVPRGSKKFKHDHVAYDIDWDDKQNRMQVRFSS